MEMGQIRYVLSAARHHNFTRAAEDCGVSQPALTKGIKALETELGAPLFNREGRKISLSTFGRSMLPHFQSIAEEAEVSRSVVAASVPGRQHSPAAAALMRAAQGFRWPG